MSKLKNSNETFWVIFKQFETFEFLLRNMPSTHITLDHSTFLLGSFYIELPP